MFVEKTDSQIAKLIKKEERRQAETLNLIASENYPSKAVREALSSIFVVKYAEGRPYKRYYAGQEFIDKLETLVEERVRKIFGLGSKKWAVNVQPYSGSPANYAVLRALLKPGEKIMSLPLSHGGHLTHGARPSLSGQDFKVVNYFLNKDGLLDYKEIEKIAKKEKPKLIICGFTAYPRKIDFKKFGEISKKVKAYLLADISHITGLIIGGVHPNPFPWADVVMTTTHKTLRGPRGAIIICKKELEDKIFKKVFPGLQGGPHGHTICAIGVALKEAMNPKFKRYASQIVKNAKILGDELKKYGFNLISGGTDNHLVLVDLTNKNITGKETQILLEKAGIVTNKNTIPYDPRPPFNPSGLRLGTPAITTRGMKEKEMEKIAFWINEVISNPKSVPKIKKQVKKLCQKFPIL
ncbi:MAG: serine hydroxymethyltransferase [Candidatus Nealsonbacteria bacterium CG_4_8_14_3_um_filter_37_36]|uniref:Serine hydroxymethyltransferase n=4 Tax=Candidatus Nealsoniibacteriota TaxID=1817911 RepID=A0A2M7EBP1_9BACT|nr:MAG: serine hydroxymethyltransferase [Candidatus Nealsonbacteria bacterium CG01_land_8_20_14_3_00_12]PIW35045.1 MAG: serine hydroxymethyltransferase [Candidatus Nealsonbacteria bacterium CG15_BIG_FIL_POST_REV_8_21_14_020_37_12]PIW91605.1 MAG: serine hydroxymethyltransferase [Candidatus Nealsonbacteria bacterium CG_4_8_14_3_um_filter_37_36]PJA83067.1 MAG: serine hydroxymethyltransferase [Candidatus Nealsonbacteria bacterium CG_4_9_14_3_um_filter_37_29]